MGRHSWAPDKRTNEKIPHCTGSFNDLPSTKEWSNEQNRTEQNTSEHAEDVLLEIYERLGKISAAGGRGV